MTLGLLLKLLHILSAVWLFCGLVGRALTFRQAAHSPHVQTVYAMLNLSELFEARMVIPASMAVLLFGLLTAWIVRWPMFGFLQGNNSNWLLASLVLYLSPTPAIPLYLVPRRKRRAKIAEEALAQGRVTPELTAALNDRGVVAFRTVELVVAVIVLVLMVTKPF